MYIKSLKLQNFRNYADESFAFDPAVNLICGENGQGKTNLLEAAAACSTMRLFRTAQKKEGLRFGENHAFIFADFLAQERDISLELRFSRTKAMEIYKNGVRQKRQSDAQGLLKTVLFCPEDLMLVRAGAAARRRFLDTALCQMRPNYARYLEEYNRLHEHKTRILRDSEEKPSLLSMWEDFSLRMAHIGAQIIRYRAYYCRRLLEALLREGDENLLRAYQNRFPGVIRYITVSPEVPGVVDMIGKISQDVTVAIGHSGADYDTSMEAIRRGARCVTHTFNAMRLFHQHQPAIMGAALESDCWCEAICDGRHLHPGTVRMLLKCKGWDRVIAITDSIMAAGLPDGNYKLGVNDVVVRDGDAVLASNGVRAGSTLTLAQALRNIVAFTDHPVQDVIPLMTANPAKALRMDDRKGSIEGGKDADMVLLDDALNVVTTVGLGRVIYTA